MAQLKATPLPEETSSRSECLPDFRQLVENSADMTLLLDRSAAVLYASPNFAEIVGIPAEQIIGQPFYDFVLEPDLDLCTQTIATLIETGGTVPFDFRIIRAPSGLAVVQGALSGLRDSSGKIARIHLSLRNTLWKDSETKVMQRRAQIRGLFAYISNRMLSVNVETFEACVQDCLKTIAHFTFAERCNARLMDSEGVVPGVYCASISMYEWNSPGWPVLYPRLTGNSLPMVSSRVKRIQTTQISSVNDLPEDSPDRIQLEQLGIRSYLNVPLARENKIVCIISLATYSREQIWPDHIISVLQTCGEMLAGAYHHYQALKYLKESEEKYRALVEHAQDGIALLVDNRFAYANPAFRQMIGVTEANSLQNNPADHFPLETLKSCPEAPAGEPPDQVEMQLKRCDGTYVDALASVAKVRISDSDGILALFKDITAQKNAQRALREVDEKYRVLVENSCVGITMTVDHKYVYANPSLLRMLGYTLEEFLALPVENILANTELGKPLVLPRYEQRLAGGDLPNGYEIQVATKKGEILDALLWAGRVETGGRVGVMAMVQDITELKRAQRDLQQLAEQLNLRVQERTADLYRTNAQLQQEISERIAAEQNLRTMLAEKEVLLREVHHRVKNNLQIIISLMQLQQDYVNEPSASRMISDIRQRVFCMSLIHEILCQPRNIGNIDISDYIRTLTSNLLYSYLGSSDDVELIVETSGVILTIDTAIAVGLIVNELVSNALKHAFAGRNKGTVRVELSHRENKRLVLSVSDDGAGLPQSLDVEKVESLGLQLVQALTMQLEGELHIHRNSGTTFNIEFALPSE